MSLIVYAMLVALLILTLLSMWLRGKLWRPLFTILAVLMAFAFFSLLGFVVGDYAGNNGLHLTHLLF
ncbi:hypothetical protein D2Q93_01835 [Alicyclobacillaceae bacterium I2511]|nr:hypothetical protein D2Q93_01835 [Alicyclobacillaceae bacterium I2511]